MRIFPPGSSQLIIRQQAEPKANLPSLPHFPHLSIARGDCFISATTSATYDEADDASYKLGLPQPV